MKQYLILFAFFIASQFSFGQTIQISGFVRDQNSNEALIGAHIVDNAEKVGCSTDNNGYFTLKINTPSIISVSYIGYSSKQIKINNHTDTIIVLKLETDNTLDEISVKGEKYTEPLRTRLSSKNIEFMPSLTGKPDVIKVLQLLPGVQTQSEGLSVMMVRGGDPGQNLYLLDNVPLTYVNHLGGFMSVFNPDMINTIDFYNGNFPAKYSGKLSSVVSITQREGNLSKHKGAYSVGITDVSCLFEGPLFNKKISYLFTARKTLTDIPLAAITAFSSDYDAVFAYGFHDFNLKLNWKYNQKNNLSINLYQGDDYLNYWYKNWSAGNNKNEKMHAVQRWGNSLLSLRWNKVIGAKLYAENTASFTWYRNTNAQFYAFDADSAYLDATFKNRSSVGDLSLRSFWKYAFNKNWNIGFGGQMSYLISNPNYIYNSLIDKQKNHKNINSLETSIYFDNSIRIFPFMHLTPSLRINHYINNRHSFFNAEPRVNIKCNLSPKQDISIDYMKVVQNSHMVFTQSEIIKKEIWLPASKMLPPQLANQVSVNYSISDVFQILTIETSLYLKYMCNLTTLKEGYENIIGITAIDNKLEINGIGVSKGIELTVKKITGKWTGAFSYAFSNSEREFENVNYGIPYQYDYNRKHSFTIHCGRKIKNKWRFSATWSLQSGLPFTPALAKQYKWNQNNEQFDDIGLVFGAKNSDYMQAYHRLDIAFNKTTKTKKGNKAIWNFSLYNAYNRINPFLYYYDNDNIRNNMVNNNQPLHLYKLSMFSIIPNISYKVYFDYTKKRPEKKKKIKRKTHWLYFDE